jgi:hypothetical protein
MFREMQEEMWGRRERVWSEEEGRRRALAEDVAYGRVEQQDEKKHVQRMMEEMKLQDRMEMQRRAEETEGLEDEIRRRRKHENGQLQCDVIAQMEEKERRRQLEEELRLAGIRAEEARERELQLRLQMEKEHLLARR